MKTIETDVAIIGSGMGGGMISRALAEKGRTVAIFERGKRLVREPANWDVTTVFLNKRYKNSPEWYDHRGKPFLPGVHYFVGGNTKVYGGSLARFRTKDFEEYQTPDGLSPAWPFSYQELEPYYLQAEHALQVHGSPGQDPTEPWRSGPYLFPAVPHEKPIQELAERLAKQGLHPYLMPMGVDVRSPGLCVLCQTCDGFPCMLGAKHDAETQGVEVALTHGASLHTGVKVTRLIHDEKGSALVAAEARSEEGSIEIRAKTFVLSAGAANSALLLLKSASEKHPNGLGNSTGLVGRNWMVHNATFMIASSLTKKNPVSFQKTLGFNDFYLANEKRSGLGNVQMLGKIQAEMVSGMYPVIRTRIAKFITDRSVDLYLESEDIPRPENRILVDSQGRTTVHWEATNMGPHRQLVNRTRAALVRAGFPLVFTKRMGIETNSHMCGTVVAGKDARTSVLDDLCRSHEVSNLFVVDSSFFPSSAAMNPALTIAAQALRVADKAFSS